MADAGARAAAIVAVAFAAGPAAAAAQAPPAATPPPLPNVVLLYADDLGYGDVHANDPACKIPTPNLDGLAQQGLRCTDAHSSSGICSPSRYALLTGRHHWRQFHEIVEAFGPSVLAPGRLTIADLLRQRGYATACVGKWHLGWDWSALRRPEAKPTRVDNRTVWAAGDFDWSRPIPGGPLAHGFDHYFGVDVPNFPPYTWIVDDRVAAAPTRPFATDVEAAESTLDCRPGPMVAGWHIDAVMPTLVAHAVAWLHERAGEQRPFFLYLPFTAPHNPIVPSAEFRGSSGIGGYGDWVAETDAAVGAVLTALEQNGQAAHTLVVFASDNGPEQHAFERVRRTGHRSMGPLRGLKRDVWEGGHRTPLLIRWPGVVAPGRTADALICQTDLMATLAAIVGATLPADAGEDSFDLLPLLRGTGTTARTALVHNTVASTWAIRDGRWLLIDARDGSGSAMPTWFAELSGYPRSERDALLFDLADDLGQRRDRSADEPARAAALQALLRRTRAESRTAPLTESASDTLDLGARLGSAGPPHRLAEPGFHVWGGSCIRGEDGSYYLFYSRWPEGTTGREPVDEQRFAGMNGWLKYSEIAVARADRPDGPFAPLGTVLRGSGDAARWDRFDAHNPHVQRFRDKVYLYYIANAPVAAADPWLAYADGQRIGVAVADSVAEMIAGKFVRSATPLMAPDDVHTFCRAVNPSVARMRDGRFLMLFKSRSAASGGFMTQWLAVADAPDGPFALVGPALQQERYDAEDPFVWYDGARNRYYAIVKDFARTRELSPQRGALVLLTSTTGTDGWHPARHSLVSLRRYVDADGGSHELTHLERPQLLFDDDGAPVCLYAAAAEGDVQRGAPTFNLQLPIAREH